MAHDVTCENCEADIVDVEEGRHRFKRGQRQVWRRVAIQVTEP